MRHTQEKTIDGIAYSMTHYPATLGWKNHAKLMKYVGGPLGLSLAGGMDALSEVPIDKIVTGLFNNIAEPEVEGLVRELLHGVVHEGQDLAGSYFDIHFQGRIGHLYKVLFEVVRFNFQDFLDVIAVAGQSAMAKAGLSPQKESSGQRGGSSSRGKRNSGK